MQLFKRISLLLVIISLVVWTACTDTGNQTADPAAAKNGDSVKILTLAHKAATLENGLKVFLVKYPSPGVVAYQLGVRVGSRNEVEAGKTGFAHFFEHLMFRGTKTLSAKEFGAIYVKNGVRYNAWTWFDMTNYHGEVASVYLEKILDAEADRFENLHFEEKALRDEAGAVLGEYNKNIANPSEVLEEQLLATAFSKHTYGHTTMGYKEDILQYPERYEDVWPFFKRYYRPSNVRVVLVGDVDFDRDLALVRKKFGDWKNPGMAPQPVPVEPEQNAPRVKVIDYTKPTQTRITVAYKVPGYTTENTDAVALKLLAEVYFSETSDFQKEFRFSKGWLDSVGAEPLETIDPFLWSINLRLSEKGKDKEKEIQDAVEAVVKKMQSELVTDAKLRATKSRFKNSALTSWFAAPDQLAGQLNWYMNFEADFGVVDRHFQRLEETTPAAMKEFAAKYLKESRRTTVILRGKNR